MEKVNVKTTLKHRAGKTTHYSNGVELNFNNLLIAEAPVDKIEELFQIDPSLSKEKSISEILGKKTIEETTSLTKVEEITPKVEEDKKEEEITTIDDKKEGENPSEVSEVSEEAKKALEIEEEKLKKEQKEQEDLIILAKELGKKLVPDLQKYAEELNLPKGEWEKLTKPLLITYIMGKCK